VILSKRPWGERNSWKRGGDQKAEECHSSKKDMLELDEQLGGGGGHMNETKGMGLKIPKQKGKTKPSQVQGGRTFPHIHAED